VYSRESRPEGPGQLDQQVDEKGSETGRFENNSEKRLSVGAGASMVKRAPPVIAGLYCRLAVR